jgi:hypothetical protein
MHLGDFTDHGTEEAAVRDTGEGPTVHLRLLPEPGLWCWELRDAHGRLLENSWSNSWVGFASRAEAAEAAARRLDELRGTAPRSRRRAG